MKKYTKGECLDTKEKFVKWIAQDKPYLNSRIDQYRAYGSRDYDLWICDNIGDGIYFQAIEQERVELPEKFSSPTTALGKKQNQIIDYIKQMESER